MIVHSSADIEQRSEEWFSLRSGIPTASKGSEIITPVRGELSKSCDKYMAKLIRQKMGLPGKENFQSNAMLEGVDREDESLDFFAFTQDCSVERVGFITNDEGTAGLSPDALYSINGTTRGIEAKNPDADTHIFWLMKNQLPDDHKVQVHMSMAITGLDWTFYSYFPGADPFIILVERDDYTKKVSAALDQFCERLAEESERFGLSARALMVK